ncbi:MAG: phosphoadenosine phosphosulfate reductase [Paracoccaceae bacterium]
MSQADLEWDNKLAAIGAQKGFYEALGDGHKALFVRGGSTLVVTFDNLDDARQDDANRLPWGSDFAVSCGWSSLGIMAHGWTWYRDDAVYDFFDRLRDEDFFAQFDKVVFYGVSMGGYGATAFSSAVPGCTVIAMSPQATLNRDLVGDWEPRFRQGWKQDFTSRYGYGPDEVATAKQAYLFWDPLVTEDAAHASLYNSENVIDIRCRRFGHGLASALVRMGILKKTVMGIVNDDISQREIYTIMRARRSTPAYQKSLLRRLENSSHPVLTQRFCKQVLEMSKPAKRPHFVNAMLKAEQKMIEAPQ